MVKSNPSHSKIKPIARTDKVYLVLGTNNQQITPQKLQLKRCELQIKEDVAQGPQRP